MAHEPVNLLSPHFPSTTSTRCITLTSQHSDVTTSHQLESVRVEEHHEPHATQFAQLMLGAPLSSLSGALLLPGATPPAPQGDVRSRACVLQG